MVLLICLFFGCGYWADLWRGSSLITGSCQWTVRDTAGSLCCHGHCWLKGHKIINTHYFLFSHRAWFPGSLLIFTIYTYIYIYIYIFVLCFHHRHSLLWTCLGPCPLQKLQRLWNLKLYIIFYLPSTSEEEPPLQDICLSANPAGPPFKAHPQPGNTSPSSLLTCGLKPPSSLVYNNWSPYSCSHFPRVYFLQQPKSSFSRVNQIILHAYLKFSHSFPKSLELIQNPYSVAYKALSDLTLGFLPDFSILC